MGFFYKKCGCGHTVHISAKACPSCGKPKSKILESVVAIVVVFIVIFVYGK